MIEESPELAAVMRRVLKAFGDGDVPAIRRLTEAADYTLVIGSAPGEWDQGRRAVEPMLLQAGVSRPFVYKVGRLAAFQSGSVGWAGADTVAHFEAGHEVPIRMTAVFHLDQGVWRIVHWHVSTPQEDDPDVLGPELFEALQRVFDPAEAPAVIADGSMPQSTNTVTLVFTDVQDSTRLVTESGDLAWGELATAHFEGLAAIAEKHRGLVVKTMGDGAMLAFGSTRDGVDAAIDIQKAAGESRPPLKVRVGVNTGDAVKAGGDYLGRMVNLTARLAGAARAGESLVSEVVRTLVGADSGYEFSEPLTVELKGLPGRHVVYSVRPPS